MKRELRSASPPSGPRNGTYQTWRPKTGRLSDKTFALPGLKFNQPLRNPRTQEMLLSETPYLSPDDEPQDVVAKNVTVAFRLALFYRPIWDHSQLWESIAEDLFWPTNPDWSTMKKTVICHAMARKTYLEENYRSYAKPAKLTPIQKICNDAIDRFNDDWPHNQGSRYRVPSEMVDRRRREWSDMMRCNPLILVSPDFDPESTDGRLGRFSYPNIQHQMEGLKLTMFTSVQERSDPPPSRRVYSFQLPRLPTSSSKANQDTRQISPSRKRVASPDMMSPRSNKSARFPDAIDISGHRRNSSAGSFDRPAMSPLERPSVSRTTSISIPTDPQPPPPARSNIICTGPAAPTAHMGNMQSPPPSRELKEGVSAMRMYIQLLTEQVKKVASVDHTNTPDLVLSEVVELQGLCEKIQNRDKRILCILENRPY
ncbi:hypothetical protein MKZ38_006661 [Zalerion maritima]|uniref:Uncharacterized protein n=1 Tax=Zalerion maritima TaxID=339359 RepID=A0AAD5S3D3_9PEZI|nr:hypothetical protein MKZ38_006661 [Zalerion maritima]